MVVPRLRPFRSFASPFSSEITRPRRWLLLLFPGILLSYALFTFPELVGEIQDNTEILEAQEIHCVSC